MEERRARTRLVQTYFAACIGRMPCAAVDAAGTVDVDLRLKVVFELLELILHVLLRALVETRFQAAKIGGGLLTPATFVHGVPRGIEFDIDHQWLAEVVDRLDLTGVVRAELRSDRRCHITVLRRQTGRMRAATATATHGIGRFRLLGRLPDDVEFVVFDLVAAEAEQIVDALANAYRDRCKSREVTSEGGLPFMIDSMAISYFSLFSHPRYFLWTHSK